MSDDSPLIDYPAGAFYFTLSFPDLTNVSETSFSEVSGFSMEMTTEEIQEGGENRFKHKVPNGTKYPNLILKRGFVSASSNLAQWCQETISGGLAETIVPKTIVVSLKNNKDTILKKWNFANAWPVKWETSELNSMNNTYVIETLEFAYSYFE